MIAHADDSMVSQFTTAFGRSLPISRWKVYKSWGEKGKIRHSNWALACKASFPRPFAGVKQGRMDLDGAERNGRLKKGRCNRDKPPCKYFHPPQHLKDQLLINGRNHLALKNALMQQMGIASGQPVLAGQVPTVAANPYLTGIPANTYSPYFAPGHLVPALLGPDPAAVASQLGPVVPQAVQVTQQKLPRSDRLEVCREFMRGACKRAESECRFAHPQESVARHDDGSITVCMDAVKGRCTRDPCRYFHPPLHLQAQLKAAQSRATAVAAAAATAPVTVSAGTFIHHQQQHQQQQQQQPSPPSTTTGTAALTTTQQANTANTAAPAAVAHGQQHTLELGKKRAAGTDMFQLMDVKTVGSFYYENFAYSGMVPIKRPAAEKYGNPVYPGATTYQQLMQLQQPFVPISCEYQSENSTSSTTTTTAPTTTTTTINCTTTTTFAATAVVSAATTATTTSLSANITQQQYNHYQQQLQQHYNHQQQPLLPPQPPIQQQYILQPSSQPFTLNTPSQTVNTTTNNTSHQVINNILTNNNHNFNKYHYSSSAHTNGNCNLTLNMTLTITDPLPINSIATTVANSNPATSASTATSPNRTETLEQTESDTNEVVPVLPVGSNLSSMVTTSEKGITTVTSAVNSIAANNAAIISSVTVKSNDDEVSRESKHQYVSNASETTNVNGGSDLHNVVNGCNDTIQPTLSTGILPTPTSSSAVTNAYQAHQNIQRLYQSYNTAVAAASYATVRGHNHYTPVCSTGSYHNIQSITVPSYASVTTPGVYGYGTSNTGPAYYVDDATNITKEIAQKSYANVMKAASASTATTYTGKPLTAYTGISLNKAYVAATPAAPGSAMAHQAAALVQAQQAQAAAAVAAATQLRQLSSLPNSGLSTPVGTPVHTPVSTPALLQRAAPMPAGGYFHAASPATLMRAQPLALTATPSGTQYAAMPQQQQPHQTAYFFPGFLPTAGAYQFAAMGSMPAHVTASAISSGIAAAQLAPLPSTASTQAAMLLDTLPVCQDFNRSMCSRLNCRFVHLTEDDKVEVCDQRVAVCRDHANGQCRRKQCKYYHIPIVLPPANVMAALINSNTSGISNNNINNNLNQEQQQQQQSSNNYKQQQQQQQQKLAGSTIATTNYNNNLIIIEPQHQHPAQQSQQQIHNFDVETTIAGGYGTLTNKIALTTASSKIYNTAPPPPPAAAVAYHPVHYTTAGTPYHHPHHQLQQQHHHYHITPPYSPSAASTTSSNSSACPKPTSPILSSTTTLSTNSTATKPTPIAATHYVPTTTFLKASPAMTIAIATQAPLLLGNTNTNSEYGSNCIPIITTPPALTPLTPVTQHPAFMYPATPQTQH
uniref:C3H1-type domain-containing protein n=1 Tax=Glossina morsitans morsitans TaxID=37546 RepID=A0A1B0FEL9_GLOMM